MPLLQPWITGKHGAQEIGLETTRKSSEDEEKKQNSIHPHLPSTRPSVKTVILKNFKTPRNDPETKGMFPLPPLISFKCNKKIGDFLVRTAFKSDSQPGMHTIQNLSLYL